MKRDWDYIRDLLTQIEEGREILKDMPDKPKFTTQTEAEYQEQMKKYTKDEEKICGHWMLLSENGYVDGVKISRSLSGSYILVKSLPRLTMAGHDLLDTIRSQSLWEKVKDTAKQKGVELTFDSIKTISAYALSQILK